MKITLSESGRRTCEILAIKAALISLPDTYFKSTVLFLIVLYALLSPLMTLVNWTTNGRDGFRCGNVTISVSHGPNGFFAHTDYDEVTDKKRQAHLNGRFSRPPHAAEGAQTIAEVLSELFPQDAAQAAYTAIVRHHSPGADKVHRFSIGDAGQKEAERVFALVTGELWKTSWTPLLVAGASSVLEESVAEYLTKPDGMATDSFLIYLLLARALRISDQQSLAESEETET